MRAISAHICALAIAAQNGITRRDFANWLCVDDSERGARAALIGEGSFGVDERFELVVRNAVRVGSSGPASARALAERPRGGDSRA